MRRHLLKALLLLAGAALTVFLFFYYSLDTIIVPWFWSAEESVFIVSKTFLLRRLMRPVWRTVLRFIIIAFIGYRTAGMLRRRIVRPVYAAFVRAYDWWMSVHGIWRALAGLGVCILAATIVWTTYRVAFVPLIWLVAVRLYYALGDIGLNEWMARFQLHIRYERFIHRNRIVRIVLRRPRHEMALAYRRLERLRERRVARKGGEQ